MSIKYRLLIIIIICGGLISYHFLQSKSLLTIISGKVVGLSGTPLTLRIGNDLAHGNNYKEYSITANGEFSYPVTMNMHEIYNVTVIHQPTLPKQTCSVSHGSGVFMGTPITNVALACSPWTKFLDANEPDSFTQGNAIATDSHGNIYIAGYTDGDFDSQYNYDKKLLLVAYDSRGNMLFSKVAAIKRPTTIAYGITVDRYDNIYVTGEAGGDMYHDDVAAGAYFIAKYNSKGDNIYTILKKNFGIKSMARAVAADSQGNIYVIGDVLGYDQKFWNDTDLFVTKYDSQGKEIFTSMLGDHLERTSGMSVAIDRQDNVYVAGTTTGHVGDDEDERHEDDINDSFLVKYDSLGKKIYTKQIYPKPHGCSDTYVVVDEHDNAYLVGSSGGHIADNDYMYSNELFIIKYDTSGKELFKTQLHEGNPNTDAFPHSVMLDSQGNIIIVGDTKGPLFGNKMIGGWDLFLTKIDLKGRMVYTKLMGTLNGYTIARGVATDSKGNFFVTGETSGSIDGNKIRSFQGLFLIKYDNSGNKL